MTPSRPVNGTMVRLIACYRNHSHARSPRMLDGTPSVGKRLIGQMIPIVLPPMVPEAHWRCGTRWVWKIETEFLVSLGMDPEDAVRVVVCEHAIETD